MILARILPTVATFGASARPADGKIGIERKRQDMAPRAFPVPYRPTEPPAALG